MITTPDREGPKIILLGAAGSGKSFSLVSMIEWAAKQVPPRRVIALYTENSIETVLDHYRKVGKPVPANFFYHVVRDKSIPFKDLMDGAKKVGMLNYKAITELVDPNRSNNNPYYKIMETLAKFTDDRTGESLGNIGDWTAKDIFVIDSLSELANAAAKMVIGNKPVMSQPEYLVAQNNLLNFLRYITQGFPPTVVVMAHVQRQTNEVTGSVKLMVKAIGKALGDEIPPLFSEVIGCVRDGANWYWDTADSSLDTKTRYLTIASKIKPDFSLIMEPWSQQLKEAA